MLLPLASRPPVSFQTSHLHGCTGCMGGTLSASASASVSLSGPQSCGILLWVLLWSGSWRLVLVAAQAGTRATNQLTLGMKEKGGRLRDPGPGEWAAGGGRWAAANTLEATESLTGKHLPKAARTNSQRRASWSAAVPFCLVSPVSAIIRPPALCVSFCDS